MKKVVFNFLTGIALAISTVSAVAASPTVASTPEGMITFTIPHGQTTYLSLPLTKDETYTGSVVAVTANSISVGDSPSPFTTSLSTPSAPYFVKMLSGNEIGRVLLITSNSTSTLTLDSTDHTSGSPVLLTTAGFDVEVGDTFEIFPGDTLASVFGANTAQSPLFITGGANILTSDSVSFFTIAGVPAITYFFNTTDGIWEQNGTSINANNVIIYPYSAFAVTRRAANGDMTLVVSGRVTPVVAETKIMSKGTVYTSTHYATDVKLSDLQFGANWIKGPTIFSADTLSVWNTVTARFDTFYQKPDSTWRKFPDANTDQSNFSIAAGTVTTITKRETVAGASTLLESQMPYNLD